MSVLHNIRIEANADFELAARWTNEAEVPYPINDAVLEIRDDTGDLILRADLANGRITIDGDGWANVNIDESVLGSLTPWTQASYDLLVWRTADGFQKRLLEGKAIYSAGTTIP